MSTGKSSSWLAGATREAIKNPTIQNAVLESATSEISEPVAPEKDLSVDVDPQELGRLKKLNYGLRFFNIGVSVLMAYAAAESLTSSSVGTVFIACYVFFFAALICCFECALSGVSRAISSNFGFMYGLAGRSFFLLFVAGMCYRLGLAGIITMALLGVSWLTYVAIRYKHPKYEEYVRKVHYAGIGQTSSKKFFIV